MRNRLLSCVALFTAALVIGCDEKPKEPKVDTNTNKLPAVVDDIKTKADNAAKNASAGASDALAAAKDQGTALVNKMKAAIENNRLDEAQTYVDAVEKIKTNLPEDIKAQYEKLKTRLSELKAKAIK